MISVAPENFDRGAPQVPGDCAAEKRDDLRNRCGFDEPRGFVAFAVGRRHERSRQDDVGRHVMAVRFSSEGFREGDDPGFSSRIDGKPRDGETASRDAIVTMRP